MTTIHALPKEVRGVMLSYLPPWEVRAMSRHQPKPEDATVFACVNECFVNCDVLWKEWVRGYGITIEAKSVKVAVSMHFHATVKSAYSYAIPPDDADSFEKYRYLCERVTALIGDDILQECFFRLHNTPEEREKYLKKIIARRDVAGMRLLLDGIVYHGFEVRGDLAAFRNQILAAARDAGTPFRELFYEPRDLQSRAVIEEMPAEHPSAADGQLSTATVTATNASTLGMRW